MAIVKSMRKLPSRIAREVKVGVSDSLLGPFESALPVNQTTVRRTGGRRKREMRWDGGIAL